MLDAREGLYISYWVDCVMTNIDMEKLSKIAQASFRNHPVENRGASGELREFILKYAKLAQAFGRDQSKNDTLRVWWKGTQMIKKCVPQWKEANVRVMLNRLVDEQVLEHSLFEGRRVYRLA